MMCISAGFANCDYNQHRIDQFINSISHLLSQISKNLQNQI